MDIYPRDGDPPSVDEAKVPREEAEPYVAFRATETNFLAMGLSLPDSRVS